MSRGRSKADQPAAPALTHAEIAAAHAMTVYEDRALLVLDKPSGLPVQSRRAEDRSLEHLFPVWAPHASKPLRLVHRLDRPTSGVIALAKTRAAAAALSAAFAARRVAKTYLALVAAAPDPPAGEIDRPLRKATLGDIDRMLVCASDAPGAQEAVTAYRTLAAAPAAALLAVQPFTGRLHQIRAHLAAIDRPVLGDDKYEGGFLVGGRQVARLQLHAWRLVLPHPSGAETRIFTAPPPPELTALWSALGLDVEAALAGA